MRMASADGPDRTQASLDRAVPQPEGVSGDLRACDAST